MVTMSSALDSAPHRLIGILGVNSLFGRRDEVPRRLQGDALAEFERLGPGLPILGPVAYGEFETSPHLVYRGRTGAAEMDEVLHTLAQRHFESHHADGACLVVQVDFTPSTRRFANARSPDALSRSIAVAMIADTLQSLSIAASIARPAAFDSTSIYVIERTGGRILERRRLISDLWMAREYAERTGWPRLSDLSIVEVWSWLLRNCLPVRTGDSELSRAYNALSYLFAPDVPEAFQFLSALMGIEAIFSSGRPGVASQIVERTQLVLGERKSFKGDLRRAYELRSALIHGSLGFPGLHFSYSDPPGLEKRRADVDSAQALAIAVLVATLQRHAEKNLTRLSFNERVVEHSEEFDELESEEVGYDFVRFHIDDIRDFEKAGLPWMRDGAV